MSIFGKIKDAIFGKAAAAAPAAPQAQTPAQGSAAPQSQPAPAAAPAAQEPVDVESALMVFETERGTADLNWRTSIVDLMSLLGMENSLAERKELAKELGYTGDMNDSATMNIWLHKQVMKQMAANGGKVPAHMLD